MSNSEKSQPKWLTIGQASKYLGISRDTLRRWEKAGKIKAVRSPTNRRYYTQKQLDEVMNGKGETAPEPKAPSKLPLALVGLVSLLAAAVLGFLIQIFLLG